MVPLKVALFCDSHYEANGVARTTGALEDYAARRDLRLLTVHAGPVTRHSEEGSIRRLELARSRLSFAIEHDMRFDMAMWRHLDRVTRALLRFKPDVLHFTGPSDVGQLGAYLGYRLGIPMVGSWHTNLHEYAARRAPLRWIGSRGRPVRAWIEDRTLSMCVLFYRIPRVVVAPNEEWAALLGRRTGKRTFVMSRGVDTVMFDPAKRNRTDGRIHIGYVGRLSPEKSVRVLADLERALTAHGMSNIRFIIVGDGNERAWLARTMQHASFTGVLRGDELATAYANMDLFAFPSETETVGNVVLEALASGVAVVAMAHGGPRFVATSPAALLAENHDQFVETAADLARDGARRAAMGLAARAHALERSWDAIFDELYRTYAVAASIGRSKSGATDDNLIEEHECVAG